MAKSHSIQQRNNREFLKKVLIWAFVIRIGIVMIFVATDAIYHLRLSPDSERYHREAQEINVELDTNIQPIYGWKDDGWFRFTALVYRYLGAHSLWIQILNVSFSVLTVYVASILASQICKDPFVYRATVLFTAFFPSFIYWSCMMLKDPIAILAMTTIITGTIILRDGFSLRWLLVTVAALLVFYGVRDYMFFVSGAIFAGATILFLPRKHGSYWSAVASVPTVVCILPLALGLGWFANQYYKDSIYFDMDYINNVRVAMGDHGTGAMFKSEDGEVATWGDDMLSNIATASKGVFYFFFVIDITNVNSTRQIMALPEVILLMLLMPSLWRGMKTAWKHRVKMIPLLLFVFIVMAVYLSATTNMGALFRWKMQVMPAMMILIAMGVRLKPDGLFFRWGCKLVGLKQYVGKNPNALPRKVRPGAQVKPT